MVVSETPVFHEWDGYVTSHPLLTKLFQGRNLDFGKTVFEFLSCQLDLEAAFEDLSLEVPDEWLLSEMASGRLKMNLIGFLLEIVGARRVLEVGTFIGLSAMSMARHLGVDGRVDTIEVSQRYAAIAQRNLEANAFSDRVRVLFGDAKETLRELPDNSYDAMFIDGDKENYRFYLESALRLVKRGGLILIDDIFFHGDVFNEQPTTSKGLGAREALVFATTSQELSASFVPITNGLLLARVL